MAQKKTLAEVFHFEEEGSLPSPGPVGRIVRFLLGILILKLVYEWLFIIDSSGYTQPFILLWIVVSVALIPYVVNIGFGIKSGAMARYTLVSTWIVTGIMGFIAEGIVRSEFLWTVIKITQIYVYGHLGISFLLSAILSTPGCEMRAIPHLLGKVSGRGSQEHYCPGFIDNIDRWERERSTGSQPDA